MRIREIYETISFGKTVHGKGLTFGFEAEFISPGRYCMVIIPVKTRDDLIDHLGIHDDQIQNAYLNWKDEQDRFESYTIGDWIKSQTPKSIFDEARKQGYRPTNWFNTKYTFDKQGRLLKWTSNKRPELANLIGQKMGVAITYSGETETKDYSKWNLSSESSIQLEPFEDGLELISPVFDDFEEFKRATERTFDVMDDMSFRTNNTTGFHLNIGMDVEKFDPLKFLLFMGEHWMSDMWPRRNDEYTQKMTHRLVTRLTTDLEFSKKYFKELLGNEWLYDKNGVVNFKKLYHQGFIEVRVMGGRGYQHRTDFLHNIDRLVKLVEIACTDDKRDLYQKKLYKLIHRATRAEIN